MKIFYQSVTSLSISVLFVASVYSQNVLIGNQAFPNEPSIIMDPLRPNFILGATNLNNYYLSQDTGRTWTMGFLTSSYGVWGDPALTVDTSGNFYFIHLSNPPSGNWIDRIVCQKSTDRGFNWNDGSYTGLNGTKAQDKAWPVVDRRNNLMYVTWTQFDEYGSSNPLDSSIILFSKSIDGGLSWSDAKRINYTAGDCVDSDNTVEGAVPAVGPNGEIYVGWAGPRGLTFNRSLDEGQTWLPDEIDITSIPGGWDYAIPGIFRANGLPVTVCDLSTGPHRGTIYINWSDQRNGEHDTDIWLVKSTDGGDTWSAPVRINDDEAGHQQFFTWMTIDQSTGYLYFVFYDRRAYADENTDVYMAVSTDGGQTFINRRISESPFIPTENVFFGDYTNITAAQGIVRPIWTRLNNGELSVWTHLTSQDELITSTKDQPQAKELAFENFPNPASDYFFVSYKLHTHAKVNLAVLDEQGKVVKQILKNEKRGYGKYVERIDLPKLNLSDGVYLVQLEIDGVVKTEKQVVIR